MHLPFRGDALRKVLLKKLGRGNQITFNTVKLQLVFSISQMVVEVLGICIFLLKNTSQCD